MQVNNKLKFLAITVTMATMLVLPARAAEKGSDSAGKAATVNGAAISQADFDREFNNAQRRQMGSGQQISEDQIKANVLENLINYELLYQESRKEGVKVDEAAVGQQLDALKQRFPNEEEYKSALGKMNLTEEQVKLQIERGLVIQQFVDDKFVKKTTISEKESKGYYDAHPEFFKQPEQVKASHILIKVDPKADDSQKAEARKKIESVQQKLAQGADFGTVAKESSEGPSNVKGGDLGYFRRGQMVKPFEEKAFAMKPGEISDVVETQFGYHIIKVDDKKPEETAAYDTVKDRIDQFLKQEKVKTEVNSYVDGLKEKATVERFIKTGAK